MNELLNEAKERGDAWPFISDHIKQGVLERDYLCWLQDTNLNDLSIKHRFHKGA